MTVTDDLFWYKDAIIYELHIKAFKDKDGDGIGDFKGLIEQLDYLKDLGVTAIWLLPFYPSPQRDGGYDISDYYSINPDYGTVKDFKKLLKQAHKRGLKVITELVLNHTSDQHPWFKRARKAPIGSKERDYYVWSDTPEKYKDTRIIFQDFEASNWSWDPVAKQYYWHRFYSHQPDLNFESPEVQQEVFNVIDFWCEMGVDGFRLDAIPYLFEREGTNCENLPETHEYLKKLRAHLDKKHKNKMFLAEANMWPEDAAAYFGDGDECHMNYHFPIMPRLFMSLRMEDRHPIIDIFEQTPEIPDNCQWAMFLRNHDELTLEMVTDEERDYMYRAYTKDSLSKINLGIRHRLAPLLDNNRKKIELMNFLLFSLPGTPVLYYGDEIGMGDNVYLGDRDGVRTPMQWSPDRNGGFSETNPQRLYLPIVNDPEYHYQSVNVENQQKNLSSLLWWTKRVIDMRKRYKAFGRGDIAFLSPSNPKVLMFTRSYEGETILAVANLSRFSQAVEVELSEFSGYRPVDVFSRNKFPEITSHPYMFTMSPHGYFWFILEEVETHHEDAPSRSILDLAADQPLDLFKGRNQEILEEVAIPKYLSRTDWFASRFPLLQHVNIEHVIPVFPKTSRYLFLIIRVELKEGFPEKLLIPVSLLAESPQNQHDRSESRDTIANFRIKKGDGFLVDATTDEQFRARLLETLMSKKSRNITDVEFNLSTKLKADLKKEGILQESGRVLESKSPNISIMYGNHLFIKFYRRLDTTPNPEMEILEFLSTETEFEHVPAYLGHIGRPLGHKNPTGMIMASLQDLVTHQGNAWQSFSDSVNRFFERVMVEKDQLHLGKRPHDYLTLRKKRELPPMFDEMIGTFTLDRVQLLGYRLADLHTALSSKPDVKGFETEPFSLHYQRSLISSMQSLMKRSFSALAKAPKELIDPVEVAELLSCRKQIEGFIRTVLAKKSDANKIRIHGSLLLEKVLFSGNDYCFVDFEGHKRRAFSENRLKKSALRDLASLLRSLHHATFTSIMPGGKMRSEDSELLMPWARNWYNILAGELFRAYLERADGQPYLASKNEENEKLLEVFLLERAMEEIETQLDLHSGNVMLPVATIMHILNRNGNKAD